jgi:uncharacterized circularly permuted ATP-grasp superfamily protein/uncharacterized alpha-E superfamily protein
MSTVPPPSQSVKSPSWLGSYRPPIDAYDELLSPDGGIRPAWTPLVNRIEQLGPQRLQQTWQRAQRMVRDSGIIYQNVAEVDAQPRPWKVDAIPWVIPQSQWLELAEGLQQRARLLNRILADLYGPQELLAGGHLPPELLFRHPAYTRAFQGLRPAGGCYLHCYTADLARSSDGRWWVIADRTDAPLGVGYALENRLVLSRTYPNIFHQYHVQRLAPFFLQLQETLRGLAPKNRDNPRIALLTEGPGHAGYFEDVYLARYLGYTLVESGDLTVRDNCLLLKTLGGLVGIDVLFRRVSDQLCDPLELRHDAALGVAGLVRAIRARQVAVANALGSSLVESTAFLAFLGPLCQHLLGQSLKIPSLATWWCGQAKPAEYVWKHRDRLRLGSAYRLARHQATESRTWEAAGNHGRWPEGHLWVGQEQVSRSVVPVWNDEPSAVSSAGIGGQIGAMRTALRVYLVFDGHDYQVLPGGLARVAEDHPQLEYDVLVGSKSKDVWVVSPEPVPQVTLLGHSDQATPLRRVGSELPSRVADHLLWLGRYVERLEGQARLLRAVISRSASEADADQLPQWWGLIRQLADRGIIEPDYAVQELKASLPQISELLPRLVWDGSLVGSVRNLTDNVLRVASIVRDRLSPDSWRVFSALQQKMQSASGGGLEQAELGDALATLHEVLRDIAAFQGMLGESMTRTLGWRFLDLGRRLERAEGTATIVRQLCDQPDVDASVWQAFCEVADSLMTYRSRYLAHWSLDAVLDLLLTDPTNPRSVIYQLRKIVQHLDRISSDSSADSGALLDSDEQRLAADLLHRIRMLTPQHLSGEARLGGFPWLYDQAEQLVQDVGRLFEILHARYVVHAVPARSMDN